MRSQEKKKEWSQQKMNQTPKMNTLQPKMSACPFISAQTTYRDEVAGFQELPEVCHVPPPLLPHLLLLLQPINNQQTITICELRSKTH